MQAGKGRQENGGKGRQSKIEACKEKTGKAEEGKGR
jgi:hypothetical protein